MAGAIVNVVLTLTNQTNAVVIPSTAIQNGPDGEFVFVVRPDLTVEPRAVSVGMVEGLESVIEKGLKPGERVVTEGQLRLTAGSRVEIKN